MHGQQNIKKQVVQYRTVYYLTSPTNFGLVGHLQRYYLLRRVGEWLNNKCCCDP